MTQTVTDAIKAVSGTIDSAHKEVIIVSGKLFHECYDSSIMQSSIQKALKRNVKFSVLTGPIDPKTKKTAQLLGDNIFVVGKCPVVHFTLADGKNLRFEIEDIDDNGNSSNVQRKGDRVSGLYLKKKYIEALRKAVPYSQWKKS